MSNGLGDGVPVVGLRSSDGTVGISGSGDVDLSAAGGGVAPAGLGGSFQRLPGLVNTNSLVPVLFWAVPFTLVAAGGDVLFDMASIAFMTNTAAAATAWQTLMGTVYTCTIDGNALPDASAVQIQLTSDGTAAPTSIPTWTQHLNLQSVAIGLAAGAHIFRVFFQVLDVNCTTQTAANEASISIRRL